MSKVDVLHDTLSMGRGAMMHNIADDGETGDHPDTEDLSLTGRVTGLEDEVKTRAQLFCG